MLSIRAARDFHGAPISLAALGQLEGWGKPYSLRQIASATNQNAVQFWVNAGDVRCSGEVSAWSSGRWIVKASFTDFGQVFGDVYALDVTFGDGKAGVRMTGVLGAHIMGGDQTEEQLLQGSDPWIQEHWAAVAEKGFQWTKTSWTCLFTSSGPAGSLSFRSWQQPMEKARNRRAMSTSALIKIASSTLGSASNTTPASHPLISLQ